MLRHCCRFWIEAGPFYVTDATKIVTVSAGGWASEAMAPRVVTVLTYVYERAVCYLSYQRLPRPDEVAVGDEQAVSLICS